MVESMLSTPPSSVEESCAERPTLAAVARAANVSLATASYAVRGDPKIPGATRQRICAIAKRIGYTPNPELGRLMFLLRERHKPQIKATLALVTVKGLTVAPSEFGRGMARGMRERAAALGFALDALEIDPAQMGRARATQILLSRGVRGVILAPLAAAADCAELLDWEKFAAVAVTNLARSPGLARVIPHHFQIAELALRRLAATGRRRVLWVARGASEEAAGAVSLAAHDLAQRGTDITLLALRPSTRPEEMAEQARQHAADAVLVVDAKSATETAAALHAGGVLLPLYLLQSPASGEWTGVHVDPQIVGELAVETLARLLQAGERGSASGSAVTMIEGAWLEGSRTSFTRETPLAAPSARARAS